MMDGKHKIPPNRNNASRLPSAVARAEPMIRSPTRKGSIDPTKDKFAYFKDNVQDPHDQDEDFDPNIYYYHRPEKEILDHPGASAHYPANPSGGSAAPFSANNQVYNMHAGTPVQLQNTMTGRPVMQMAPNASQSSNIAQTSNLASFPTSANLAGGPNAQYRFGANGANGVPITVLGRSGSPAVGHMAMGVMGGTSRGNMGMPASQPGVAAQPRASISTRTSSGSIPPPNAPPPASAASGPSSVSPMRMVNVNNSGLGNSSGGLGMTGLGVPIGMMGGGLAIPGSTISGIPAMNNINAGMGGSINMGMPGYAQTLQGMGNKAVMMKDKQTNLLQQQQGYELEEHAQDRELGHELTDSPPIPSALTPAHPTQAQLLRQSLNGMNATHHMHTTQSTVPPTPDSSSFDSGFPMLGSRSTSKPDFNLAGDDFPALPLKASAEIDKTDHTDLPYQGFSSQMKPLSHSSGGLAAAMPLGSSGNLTPGPTSAGSAGSTAGSLLQMQQTQKLLQSPLKSSFTQPTPSTSQANTGFVPDRFGLLGLLSVIRMTDPDLNTLALGTDLTTLGLNLNSPDCLYATFASPFADGPSKREPDFYLPSCYYTQPPMQPASMKIQMFTEETLLYIFYSMPRDVLQLHAATELYMRDWRYHKEHKLWFTRVPSTEPLVKTTTYERGSYFYFDPNTWEKIRKDNFVLCYDQIDTPPKP